MHGPLAAKEGSHGSGNVVEQDCSHVLLVPSCSAERTAHCVYATMEGLELLQDGLHKVGTEYPERQTAVWPCRTSLMRRYLMAEPISVSLPGAE